MHSLHVAASSLLFSVITGCAATPPPPLQAPAATTSTVTAAPATSTTATAPKPAAPIDMNAVVAATGAVPEAMPDGVVKVSFPRQDVPVVVDGWKMAPFMGLTSWVAFTPGRAGLAETMIMGDLVLFEDEVNPVMSVLLANGAAVTALHNHFFAASPAVFFMHVGGEGRVDALGKGVRLAMEKVAAIRKASPKPAPSFAPGTIADKSSIDGSKIEAILGKGQAKDGMYKFTVGRRATASCGCAVGKTMGVNTWAAFGGSDDAAVVDGDFAVTEDELQKVLASLRASGIDIVAIHHHMVGESPRILFLHYWGKGKAADLAAAVKKALDLTAFDKSA